MIIAFNILLGFILGLLFFVCSIHEVEKKIEKRGFITLGDKIYKLVEVEEPTI